MSLKFRADPATVAPTAQLVCGYLELTRVDEAIHEAQQRLAAAYQQCLPQAQLGQMVQLYRDLLTLRDRSRQVLVELGELWADHE